MELGIKFIFAFTMWILHSAIYILADDICSKEYMIKRANILTAVNTLGLSAVAILSYISADIYSLFINNILLIINVYYLVGRNMRGIRIIFDVLYLSLFCFVNGSIMFYSKIQSGLLSAGFQKIWIYIMIYLILMLAIKWVLKNKINIPVQKSA